MLVDSYKELISVLIYKTRTTMSRCTSFGQISLTRPSLVPDARVRASQKGLRASHGGGRMDVHTDGQDFSPFYRTLSPLGAAALLPYETFQQQRSRAREPLTI